MAESIALSASNLVKKSTKPLNIDRRILGRVLSMRRELENNAAKRRVFGTNPSSI